MQVALLDYLASEGAATLGLFGAAGLAGAAYGPTAARNANAARARARERLQSQILERNQFLRRPRAEPPLSDMPRRPRNVYGHTLRAYDGYRNTGLRTWSGGKINGYAALKRRWNKYKTRRGGALVSKSAFRNLPSELKVNDVDFGGFLTNIASTNPLLLNGIATGTDYNTRVGRQAWIKSIDYRIAVYPQATTSVPGAWIRYLILCDEQPNGTAPVWSDIINSSTDVAAFNNLNNRDRFTILRDQFVNLAMIDLSATGAGLTGKQKFFKKGRIIPKVGVTTYNGTGSTYTSINTCALWFFAVTDQTASTITCNARFRVRFVDE